MSIQSDSKKFNKLKHNFMSIKNTFTLEELHGYVAPSVSVLACQNEGILCASGFDVNNRTEVFDRLEMEEL